MSAHEQYYTNQGSEYHYGTLNEVQKEADRMGTKVHENPAYKAYWVYYNAINEYGVNNNAAYSADKNGYNWTCDHTDMWHQAREDLGL